MAQLPLNANLETAHTLALDLAVPSCRWTSFQRKVRTLSRNGLTNLMAAGAISDAACASHTEESLRAAYEGPLSATYLALSTDNRNIIDRVVTRVLGGTSPTKIGMSDSALGSVLALNASGNPATHRP
jgi:hypothetical protein